MRRSHHQTLDKAEILLSSRRSLTWISKKDYLEGLGDSVDLVPIGACIKGCKSTGVFSKSYLLLNSQCGQLLLAVDFG